jgi:hypothetical protein
MELVNNTIRFKLDDFCVRLPAPGFHPAIIRYAELRRSEAGNLMVQIVFDLEDAPAIDARIVEYFVIEGPGERFVAFARRRLASLVQASGINVAPGDEFDLDQLVKRRLQIRITHQTRDDETRVRVTGFKPL